jgi:Na+:H+ antiporter, NhaA family
MRLVGSVGRFLHSDVASGLSLLGAIGLAVVLANSPVANAFLNLWSTPLVLGVGAHGAAFTIRGAINEGLMTLFFFVVGLEIKRELTVGELRRPRVAALPIAAAIGGMVVPALLYLALQWGRVGARDWGVVMATDIAIVVGCLALLGGRVAHALRIFVLSLAIIDDIGAVLVIVLAYSTGLNAAWLSAGAAMFGLVFALRFLGVRSIPIYVVVGLLAWFSVHESGLHATLVGIALGLITPARPLRGRSRLTAILDVVCGSLGLRGQTRKAALAEIVAEGARETVSPLERIETALHPWVNFGILPLFALANAGVPLAASELGNPVVRSVIVGLVIGKPVGILWGSWTAVRLRLAQRPAELGWGSIAGAGVLCGIGFTMALFIANLAFGAQLLVAASVGILAASLISAVLGLGLLAAVQRQPSRAL